MRTRIRADLQKSRKAKMSADIQIKAKIHTELSVASLLALSGLAALDLFLYELCNVYMYTYIYIYIYI